MTNWPEDTPKSQINLSFQLIGSKELTEKINQDIEDLVFHAVDQDLIPKILTIGRVVLESIATSTVEYNFKKSWKRCLKAKNRGEIFSNFSFVMLDYVESIMKEEGIFDEDREKGFKTFYDPDEKYFRLLCIDPSRKAERRETATKDGYSYLALYYKDHILVDFTDLVN